VVILKVIKRECLVNMDFRESKRNVKRCDYCRGRLGLKGYTSQKKDKSAPFRVIIMIQSIIEYKYKRYHIQCFKKVTIKEILE